MIANGPKLLLSPGRWWPLAVGTGPRPAGWLAAAALIAAVVPAAAVVGGHLGAAVLGYVTHDIAAQRAAVGLVATVGGALVLAPALALVLMWLTRVSRVERGRGREVPAAMGIIWPAWTAGAVLAVPPLMDLGPEPGEALWAALAAVVAIRAIHDGAAVGLGVRRRWRTHFEVRAAAAFVALFLAVPIAPAFVVRGLLGVSGETIRPAPAAIEWPLPPEPKW